jgi:hypothetical protein
VSGFRIYLPVTYNALSVRYGTLNSAVPFQTRGPPAKRSEFPAGTVHFCYPVTPRSTLATEVLQFCRFQNIIFSVNSITCRRRFRKSYTMISLLRRHQPPEARRNENSLPLFAPPRELSPSRQTDDNRLSRQLLVMAYQHLLALVIFMFVLYFICRFGFGWTPGTGTPSPSVTVHVRGITDDGDPAIMDSLGLITPLIQFENVRQHL